VNEINYKMGEDMGLTEEVGQIELSPADFKASPFSDLIKALKNCSCSDNHSNNFQAIIEEAVSSISKIQKEEIPAIFHRRHRQDLTDILQEVQEILDDLSAITSPDYRVKGFDSIIRNLEELNEEYLYLRKEAFALDDEDEQEDLLKKIVNEIPPEYYYASSYVMIEEKVHQFLKQEIDDETFLRVLEEIAEILESSRREYESLELSRQNMLPQVALGDRLLDEGINEWEDAIDCLAEYCEDNNAAGILRGLRMAYKANRKLIIVQYIEKFL